MNWGQSIVMAEESKGSFQQSPQQVVKTLEVPPKTADILNHHLNNANQWYEIKLNKDMVVWQLRCRQNYDINYSYSPSATTFFTLRAGEVLSADTSPNKTLNAVWVRCATSNVIIEIEFWEK